jgi:5-methylcytosine-specific restriction endonuclease McrA
MSMVCTKCKQDTPLELMGKAKRSKTGYNIYCLKCIRAMSQAYRNSDPERNRNSQRKYLKNNRAKINERKKARYYTKPEELKTKAAKYRVENYERRLEVERNSRQKNKEKYRPRQNARQRVRNKILAEKKYLILDKELRKIYNSPCFNCGSTENQSLDHIIPISRGGNHSIGNVMTLCLKCNMSKHARTITEWKHSKNMLGVG